MIYIVVPGPSWRAPGAVLVKFDARMPFAEPVLGASSSSHPPKDNAMTSLDNFPDGLSESVRLRKISHDIPDLTGPLSIAGK